MMPILDIPKKACSKENKLRGWFTTMPNLTANLNGNCGLWVIMKCQCRFLMITNVSLLTMGRP
jgi:hypothetical protein